MVLYFYALTDVLNGVVDHHVTFLGHQDVLIVAVLANVEEQGEEVFEDCANVRLDVFVLTEGPK